MQRLRLRLANWHRQLAHSSKWYRLLAAQPRFIVVLPLLLALAYLTLASLPATYIDGSIAQFNSTRFEALYDFFDSEQPASSAVTSHPQFVFINGKYPTPKVYAELVKTLEPEKFVELPLQERCSAYFEKLYEMDPDWMIHDLEYGYPYNGYIFDTRERFMEERLNEFKKDLEENHQITDEEQVKKLVEERNKQYEWDAKYEKARQESHDSEFAMTNWMTHLRVFSQCYIDNPTPLSIDSEKVTCEENEKRLFKFLTRKYPKYVRWNREELHQLPVMEKYLKDVSDKTTPNAPENKCFTRELKDAYNGKGIAITAADKHVGELSSLILTLRALNNTMPIQIMHRGDLSPESQKALTLVSRTTELHLDKIPSFAKFAQTYLTGKEKDIFPPQEIWYVDMSEAINPDDHRFVTYGNKLLTLLFSSFEDTIVIDTDTVPFVDLDTYILQSDVYKKLGAFFFKDRMLYDRMTGPELTYFHKLLPTKLDTAFFDIPPLTNHTLQNRFFGERYKHVQESGVVAINKKRHMRSTLTINMLQMWHAATTRVHGDKELFWLGFSIAGDEEYYLNKYGVGAVGVLNPNENRLINDEDDMRRKALKSHMLCTTHPAHLSGLDDHTLLWMNSGFITCKRDEEAEKDIEMDLYKKVFASAEDLRKTYEGPQKIKAVLVPPNQERVINNDLGEPASGWDVMFGCGGYLYCAYDVVGASEDPYYQGTLVEYDEKEEILFDYLGEIWVYYEKVIN